MLAAGAIGHIATRHGDSVGLVAGPITGTIGGWGAHVTNSEHIVYVPPRRDDLHLERLLRTIHDGIDIDGEPSRMHSLLDVRGEALQPPDDRRRHSATTSTSTRRDARLLRRLAAQHEVLHCTIGDVAMTEPALAAATMRVVGTTTTIPAFFRVDDELHADLQSLADQRDRADASDVGPRRRRQRPADRRVNDGSVDRRVARTTATVRFGEPSVNGLAVMHSLLVVTGSRDTLPPADDRLYEAGPFAAGWLVVAVVAVGLGLAGLTWVLWPRRTPSIVAAPPKVAELRKALPRPPRRPRTAADRRSSSHRARCTTS